MTRAGRDRRRKQRARRILAAKIASTVFACIGTMTGMCLDSEGKIAAIFAAITIISYLTAWYIAYANIPDVKSIKEIREDLQP